MRTDVIFLASLVILESTIKLTGMKTATGKPEDLKNCAVKPMDIAFIIDASQNIHPLDFKRVLKFFRGVVSLFQIGPQKVRIAALSYGDDVLKDKAFGFDKSKDKRNVLNALSQIESLSDHGKHTNTATAIAYARKHFFVNRRPFAKQIAIVLTSNKSDYFEKTKAEVDKLKLESIKTIAIGVGGNIPSEELEMITSDPKQQFYHVDFYDELKKIRLSVGQTICKGCTRQQIDFNFVFDLAQMGPPNHKKILDFVTTVVYSHNFNLNQTRSGLITQQCHNERVFQLNNNTYPQTILAHFQMFENNFLASLMTQLRKKAFSPKNGGRQNALRVAVLFVTGKIHDEKATLNEARLVKAKKIQIFVVNMGGINKRSVLELIASGGKSRVLDATGSKNMKEVAEEVIHQVCSNRRN